jgi:hypothetical protein
MITCYLDYVIDPYKLAEFETYADLPWNFHPAESRAWVKVTSFGAV